MTEFSIDTKKKTLRVKLELAGEAEPIELQITKYTLRTKGDDTRLTIEDATASREWLTVALREFLVGKAFPIPAGAATALKLLS
jgi:hypothetical protein